MHFFTGCRVSTQMFWAGALLAPSISCGGAPEAESIPLIDRVARTDTEVVGSPDVSAVPRALWRFDGPVAPQTGLDWRDGGGIAGFGIRDGRLTGTTTSESAVIYVEWPDQSRQRDRLFSVDLALRVSAGSRLEIEFRGDDVVDLKAVQADEAWALSTPLEPGEELRHYRLLTTDNRPSSAIRHIFVRPSDVVDATFELASVRLVFDQEHLVETPSGVSWRGLSDVFHESIITKVPEAMRFPVTVPTEGWLDLSVGTMEATPTTFRVEAVLNGTDDVQVLMEHTVTTPDRWERTPVDLTALAGQDVMLSLALNAERSGAIGLWGSPVIRSRQPAAPGVILVVADTIRPDHLGAYGYSRNTTPTLSRLAADGARFDDVVAQATWTKVSTPSILTSLYPRSHGVTDVPDRLPSAALTLAEAYRAAGYATLSFSSVSFTGAATNLHQGFEEVHEAGSRTGTNRSKSAREFVDRLLPWIELHRHVPFFVFLHVFDPHSPFEPRPPYNTVWADPTGRETHEERVAAVRSQIDSPFLRGQVMPTQAELDASGVDVEAFMSYRRDWYDGSILGMDAEIGRLVQQLDQLALRDRVVVAFIGDHGEEFLEHGSSWHGETVYAEVTRVPLIIRAPGKILPGRRVDETVRTIDLMPTLLELTDLSAPETLQGQSLLPLIYGGDTPWVSPPAVSEEHTRAGNGTADRHASYALVLDGWRLIHNVVRKDNEPEFELYRDQEDPLNQTDVANDHPEIVRRLAAALERWRARSDAARLPRDAELLRTLSTQERERLRSLNYVR
ncbi:MAG: hypothetical protein CL473_08470 [Acidobacteria bacterium]|nr:hypothetical protein [Acidobacteriota bacterium]